MGDQLSLQQCVEFSSRDEEGAQRSYFWSRHRVWKILVNWQTVLNLKLYGSGCPKYEVIWESINFFEDAYSTFKHEDNLDRLKIIDRFPYNFRFRTILPTNEHFPNSGV